MSTGAQGPQGRPPTARGARLPAHVDADLRARPVVRAVCRVAARASGDADVVLVVPHGRAPLPDGLAGAVETARAHVALVSRARAVEIASARSSGAAEQLGADPPAGGRWILYLDAGARCAVVPFLMPGAPRQVNDAPDVREALPPDAREFFDALAAATPEGYEPPSVWPASQRAADVEKFARADLACLYLDGEAAARWTEAATAEGADLSTATLIRYDDGVSVAFYRVAGKGRAA